MKTYEIIVYENFHTIDTLEKFYKLLLITHVSRYKLHFIKAIRVCKKFKQFLYDRYPILENHRFAELCYWFYYGLDNFPKCNNKTCNKLVTHFRSFTDGYSRCKNTNEYYCCSSCAIIGTTPKRHATCLQIYGITNPNLFNSKNIKNRLYRQINVYQLFLLEEAIPLFSLDEYLSKNISNANNKKLLWKCTKCNTMFEAKIKFCNNKINGLVHHARCPKCYPLYNFSGHTTSISEKEVLNYIKSIYNGNIIENDRTLMIPDTMYNTWKLNHELDIVLPDIKLAFEFNGFYWHNQEIFPETVVDDLEKIRLCNNLGITLTFINENDWKANKLDVLTTILKIINNAISLQ